MKFYCFASELALQRLEKENGSLSAILKRIAVDSDTQHLVVTLHLITGSDWYGGTAYVRNWSTPRQFYAKSGKWRLYPVPTLPDDLPRQFKLIRLALPARNGHYPRLETDSYRWQHFYHSFADHLAFLFAHELHHYRRFHLGYHPREGEHSANAWAVQRSLECGFRVESERPVPRKNARRVHKEHTFREVVNPVDFFKVSEPTFFSNWRQTLGRILAVVDAGARKQYVQEKMSYFARLRTMPPGSKVWISFDPSRRYLQQEVTIVRSLRRNSLRIVVETLDGKKWRWPMAWLSEKKQG